MEPCPHCNGLGICFIEGSLGHSCQDCDGTGIEMEPDSDPTPEGDWMDFQQENATTELLREEEERKRLTQKVNEIGSNIEVTRNE